MASTEQPAEPVAGNTPAELPTDPAAPVQPAPAGISANTTTAANDAPETAEQRREAYIEKRVAELQDLGMEEDDASLDTILAELDNEDRSIRDAAVEAAVQFGSKKAIPRLTEAAARATDPEEKAAILEAIEFLNLPTLAEALTNTNRPAPEASSGTPENP